MAPILSAGPISIKIPNIGCAIYDITSNEVLMTQKVRKTKFFQWKNGCMTPKLLGGLSSSKYTILNHFWLGQLKPPRLTQCLVCQPPTFLPDIRKYAGFYEVFPKSGQKIGQSNQSVSTWHNRSVFSNVVTSLLLSASFALLTM